MGGYYVVGKRIIDIVIKVNVRIVLEIGITFEINIAISNAGIKAVVERDI